MACSKLFTYVSVINIFFKGKEFVGVCFADHCLPSLRRKLPLNDVPEKKVNDCNFKIIPKYTN